MYHIILYMWIETIPMAVVDGSQGHRCQDRLDLEEASLNLLEAEAEADSDARMDTAPWLETGGRWWGGLGNISGTSLEHRQLNFCSFSFFFWRPFSLIRMFKRLMPA